MGDLLPHLFQAAFDGADVNILAPGLLAFAGGLL